VEWIAGVALVVLGTLLFTAGLYQARTAPRDQADAGMFGRVERVDHERALVEIDSGVQNRDAPSRWLPSC
jgi:hypothetical protein